MRPGQPAPETARDPHCLFCSIVAGEVPAAIVATSEAAIAFRDLNPQAPTHVLVIPRHHAATAAETAAAGGLDALVSLAAHVAAADPRFQAVVAFAPVTDLLALREFKGMEKHAATAGLHVTHLTERLTGRSVWVCIGNNDERVGTDGAIAFTRKFVRAAAAKKAKPDVHLVVTPTPGHTIHKTAHDEAAAWLRERLQIAASPAK